MGNLLPIVSSNVTVNLLNGVFKNVGYRHSMINSYRFGYLDSNQANESKWYPIFWVVPPSATFNFNQQGYNSITYNFNFIVADLVHKDLSNIKDVLSDSYQTMWDLIQMIKYDYDYEYEVSNDIIVDDFTSRFVDDVTGVQAGVSIVVPRIFGSCDVPIKPTGDALYIDEGYIDGGYYAYFG